MWQLQNIWATSVPFSLNAMRMEFGYDDDYIYEVQLNNNEQSTQTSWHIILFGYDRG